MLVNGFPYVNVIFSYFDPIYTPVSISFHQCKNHLVNGQMFLMRNMHGKSTKYLHYSVAGFLQRHMASLQPRPVRFGTHVGLRSGKGH
jgi:hypothetical protein